MSEITVQSDWMTLNEVCIYWRVSESTGRRIIRTHGITKHNLGTTQNVRYRREDIESLIIPGESPKT